MCPNISATRKLYFPFSGHKFLFQLACQKVLNSAGQGQQFILASDISEDKDYVNHLVARTRDILAFNDVPKDVIRRSKIGISIGYDGKKIRFRYDNLMLSLDEIDKQLIQLK